VSFFLRARVEHAEIGRSDAEADQPGKAARTVQEQPGTGDPELQGRGAETAENYLPAGEGKRQIHQRSQRPHSEGLQSVTDLEAGGGEPASPPPAPPERRTDAVTHGHVN